jgi:dolichyl-phosphate beta-glucosyltransferase
MPNTPWLSVIVPAFNEERRLGATLDTLFRYLQARDYSFEILVVENASSDGTADLVRQACIHHPELQLLQIKQPGKGRAVRVGMLRATGEWRFFCDSDLSMPIEELDRFLPPCSGDADISIGSREAPGAHRHEEPLLRHITGRIFTQMVKWFVMGGFEDTQCGFKCFRAAVAEDLFSRQRLTGWSFDVEVLFLARRAGYRIREVPIPWFFRSDSRVRLIGDSLHMLMDLARIQWNSWHGLYEQKNPRAASGS